MSKLGSDFQRKAGRPEPRPRTKGRRTGKVLTQHAHAMEEMRLRLAAMRRDLDGALHFDHDNDAAQRIYRTLRLMLRETGVDETHRASMTSLLRDICVQADWHDWSYDSRPVGFDMAHSHVFSREEFAQIAIERDALKKPHDYLEPIAKWIHEEFDTDIVGQLYATGRYNWQTFVLINLDRAFDYFFKSGGVTAHPGNWPGRALKLVKTIMNDKKLGESDRFRARSLHGRLIAERDGYVKLAKKNALKPFTP
jgi:hypothetical protein